MAGYIVFIWYKLIHLNLATHRMDNLQNIICLRCREKDESHLIFYSIFLFYIFYWKLFKTTPDFINGLINLNCTFNTSFKVIPKAKAIGELGLHGDFISQFYDEIQLQVLPNLLDVFLRPFWKMDMTKWINFHVLNGALLLVSTNSNILLLN